MLRLRTMSDNLDKKLVEDFKKKFKIKSNRELASQLEKITGKKYNAGQFGRKLSGELRTILTEGKIQRTRSIRKVNLQKVEIKTSKTTRKKDIKLKVKKERRVKRAVQKKIQSKAGKKSKLKPRSKKKRGVGEFQCKDSNVTINHKLALIEKKDADKEIFNLHKKLFPNHKVKSYSFYYK
jgi:hypothetical protein